MSAAEAYGPYRRKPKSPAEAAADIDLARRLWMAGVPVQLEDPAHRYLVRRYVLRLDQLPPATVRWLPRERDIGRWPKWKGFGQSTFEAGAVLFQWISLSPQAMTATSFEFLQPDGQQVMPKRIRQTRGQRAGALFYARRLKNAQLLVLCEGELDALALAGRYPDSTTVAATGGTSGMDAAWLKNLQPGASVIIESDGDRKGRLAAGELCMNLRTAGRSVRLHSRAIGDPAED